LAELIDSHAHTGFEAFDEDRSAVYERARAAGIGAIVEVGVGLSGSRAAVARAAEHPGFIYAAAGLHPTGLESFEEDWEEFETLVRTREVYAVGECGLDYHWMRSPKGLQAEAFSRQIELARCMALPFIVHCREAEADLIAILREAAYTRGVVHCFGGTRAEAEELLELGLSISFCGNVTYKSAGRLREAAEAVPLDRLLIETDSPFLAPQAERGKRNEPAFMVHTARFLADLSGVSFERLALAATRNTRRLFDLKPDAAGTVAYPIGNNLYINITRLCTAHCYFCPREGPDRTAWGHDLALARDPGPAEILRAVGDPARFGEIVFCGLGEPFLRLETMLEAARALQARGAKVRVNTNGHGNLIWGRDVTPELDGVIDSLSISLNYHSAELYEKHCPSTFGPKAHAAILEFARCARRHVPQVVFSVVEGAEDVDVDRCRALAEECGVAFRSRPFDDLKQDRNPAHEAP